MLFGSSRNEPGIQDIRFSNFEDQQMVYSMKATDARRFLAEEIRVVHNIKSQRIIEAIATIPREQFLPPGPWQIRGGEVCS